MVYFMARLPRGLPSGMADDFAYARSPLGRVVPPSGGARRDYMSGLDVVRHEEGTALGGPAPGCDGHRVANVRSASPADLAAELAAIELASAGHSVATGATSIWATAMSEG